MTLITGAGGGIGLAAVQAFAREGAIIIASDIHPELLEPVIALVQKYDGIVHTLPGDLTDGNHCNRLAEKAVALAGRLDIVVNNAGVMRRGNILSTSDEDWALSIKINLEAVFRICRSAIGIMKQSRQGAIVNVASCWGIYPGPNHLAYCTSKAAVAAMTRCLGRDHAGDGIRINAVCPNEVNTPMLASGFEIRGMDPNQALTELDNSVPLGHIAEPDEIADVIAFLASSDARYMCGSVVEVNGAKPVY